MKMKSQPQARWRENAKKENRDNTSQVFSTNFAIHETKRGVCIYDRERFEMLQHVFMLANMIQKERRMMQGRQKITAGAKSLLGEEMQHRWRMQ